MRKRILVAAILATCALASCKSAHVTSPTSTQVEQTTNPTPRRVEVGIDLTPTDFEQRCRVASVTIPQLVAPGDTFVLRGLDNKTSILTTNPPQDEDAADATLEEARRHMIPVTDLSTYLETLAAEYEQYKGKVIIIVFTDGIDDGHAEKTAERIHKAAERLAANPQVLGVVVAGVVRDTRPEWAGLAEMLSPLKDRLQVIDCADTTPEQVMQAVGAIREQASRR